MPFAHGTIGNKTVACCCHVLGNGVLSVVGADIITVFCSDKYLTGAVTLSAKNSLVNLVRRRLLN